MAKKFEFEAPEETASHKTAAEYLSGKPKKTRRVNLVFTPEVYEKIAKAAQRSGRSLNNFIEYTLLNAIEKEGL